MYLTTPTRFSTYSLVCFNSENYVDVGLVFKRGRYFNIITKNTFRIRSAGFRYQVNWQVFISADITKLRRTREWKRNRKTNVNKVH